MSQAPCSRTMCPWARSTGGTFQDPSGSAHTPPYSRPPSTAPVPSALPCFVNFCIRKRF